MIYLGGELYFSPRRGCQACWDMERGTPSAWVGILSKTKQRKRSEAGMKKYYVPKENKFTKIKHLMSIPYYPPMSNGQNPKTHHASFLTLNLTPYILHSQS